MSLAQALQATPFFRFLGPSPERKPWIRAWIAEVEKLRRQAIADLGEEVVNVLWSELRS